MKKILVIGDSILDHYVFCKSYRISSEQQNMPIYDIENEFHALGGSLNVANNIKSLEPNNEIY